MLMLVNSLTGTYIVMSYIMVLGALKLYIITPLTVVHDTSVNVLLDLLCVLAVLAEKLLKIVFAAPAALADENSISGVYHNCIFYAAYYNSTSCRLVYYESTFAVEGYRGALVAVRELLKVFDGCKLVPGEVRDDYRKLRRVLEHKSLHRNTLDILESFPGELKVAVLLGAHGECLAAARGYVGIYLLQFIQEITCANEHHAEVPVERCRNSRSVLRLFLKLDGITEYITVT